jgi:hypothetical protein
MGWLKVWVLGVRGKGEGGGGEEIFIREVGVNVLFCFVLFILIVGLMFCCTFTLCPDMNP